MRLDNHGDVSIAELIAYVPCSVLAFMVCFRHGFKRASGWIFILILSVIRIAGSVCQLLTYSHPTEGLIKATLIIDSIGIAPLLLTVLGVLSRFVDWVNASLQRPKFNTKLFRVIQLLIGAGLILGIIGVTSSESQTAGGKFKPSPVSKAGVLLYIFNLAAITIIFILAIPNISVLPDRERPLIIHIPLALVAICIRLLYSVLCVFVHNRTFSLFGGNLAADILMAIVEEFFVVVITLVLGFKLDRINPPAEGDMINLNQKNSSQSQQYLESNDRPYAPLSRSGP
ncbi:hypothetical protein BGZ60DRAFT_368352 [Tricladium varicosporioides]|nr:hypothetical protein BGZ60DRAFT_368352 [Hymenoscyphus varicosporioides]